MLTNKVNPSLSIALVNNSGTEIIIEAKITGITPAEFNLNGI